MLTPFVRAIEPRDVPAMARMIHAIAAHHGDEASISEADIRRDCLGDSPWLHVLVAERADAIVGYAALLPMARLQYGRRAMDLHHLFVDDAFRGRGIGKLLLKAARKKAQSLGAVTLLISTNPANTAAQHFYLSQGYAPVEAGEGPRFHVNLEAA